MATILVVDDNATNRELLSTVLRYAGHHVVEAADGAEGLIKAHAARPELIVTDILMPTMDGFDFVRQVRADPSVVGTNVIFWTAAYHANEAEALARKCGVSQILTKPAEPHAILGVVNAALGVTVQLPAPPAEDFDREHLRLLTDKLSHKIQELEAIGLRLEALLDIGQRLASERNLDRLLDTVCRSGRELIGAGVAVAALLEEDGQSLRRFVIGGLEVEKARRITQPSLSQGVIPTLLSERRPVRLINPGGDPTSLGFEADQPPLHSFLGAPVVSPTSLYGWLDFRNKLGADEFTAEDERIAQTLAAQVGVACENILRYEEIQRHTRELEQRVSERTAELKRSNEELEHYAYIASHDLQEPLRKVIGFTSLLAKRYRGRLDADADEFIGYSIDAAARMQHLIQDLLVYSRAGKQELVPAPVDCVALLERVLKNLESAIAESGAVVTHDPLPTVLADAQQIEQLFQNLIGNAIKFHGENPPRAHVSARLLEPQPLTETSSTAAGRQDEREWLFSVRDNGIGIEPRHAERVFKMFQRLHNRGEYPGTGIGLAICKKVVERHDGRIWIDSEPGKGTTFHFTILARGYAGVAPGTASENLEGNWI